MSHSLQISTKPAHNISLDPSIDQSIKLPSSQGDSPRHRHHRRYSSDGDSLSLAKVLSNHSICSNQSFNSNNSNHSNISNQFYYRSTPIHSPSDLHRSIRPSYHSASHSPINQSSDVVSFLRPMLVLDADERQIACDRFNQIIVESIKISSVHDSPSQSRNHNILRPLYSHIVRLSLEAPFRNVRDSMKELLQAIDESSDNQSINHSVSDLHHLVPAHLSASKLIPPLLLPTIDEHALDDDISSPSSNQSSNQSINQSDDSPCDDATDSSYSSSALLLDQFLHDGRISHIERILAYHPSFLLAYNELIDLLLINHSTMSQCDRIFIALMSVSRMKSNYWYTWLKHLFLTFNGEIDWLMHINNAPKHLSSLSSICSVLAFKPWAIQSAELTDWMNQSGCGRSELVLSLSIICSLQALAAASEAMQIVPEIDLVPLVQKANNQSSNQSTRPHSKHVSQDMNGDGNHPISQSTAGLRKTSCGDLVTEAAYLHRVLTSELVIDFDESINQSISSNKQWEEEMYLSRCNSHSSNGSNGQPISQSIDEAFAALYLDVSDVSMRPASYASSHRSVSQSVNQSASSFTFHEHASLALDRFAPRLSSTLHRMIDTIMNITTNRIGRLDGDDSQPINQPIDTSPFRRAILVFVHRYFGEIHADFNYKHINLLLSSSLQRIIVKIIEAQPLTDAEWRFDGFGLDESEKVHLVLIVAMARMEATFTHAIRAVVKLG